MLAIRLTDDAILNMKRLFGRLSKIVTPGRLHPPYKQSPLQSRYHLAPEKA